jgi:hypothetical protein
MMCFDRWEEDEVESVGNGRGWLVGRLGHALEIIGVKSPSWGSMKGASERRGEREREGVESIDLLITGPSWSKIGQLIFI